MRGLCEPEIRETPAGWMAYSPPDFPYRIGVVGETREEARGRFTDALEAWRELEERVQFCVNGR
jgi:predicted RNase H-like HicB family nuclease